MKQILSLLAFSFIIFTNTQSQIRNDDFFPLAIGNQWTYSYNTSYLDQLQDILYIDSGTAVSSITLKNAFADSVIWGFREARNIVRHISYFSAQSFDTSFSIIDATFFGVAEHLNGNHLLVRTDPFFWDSVLPITQEFADSATFFRYSLAIADTATLTAQYPKSASKPYFILVASFKRLIGPTRISISGPYLTGATLSSNHVLTNAIVTSTKQSSVNPAPKNLELNQNFPNPFNPVTVIPFSIAYKSYAKIRIYDLLGRYVETVFDNVLEPGNYRAVWNALQQSSGTYVCVLQANGITKAIKLVLLK